MKKLLLFVFIMATFMGCESTDDSTPQAITIPTESLSVALSSSDLSKTVAFTATTDWAISLDEVTKATPDWITVSPMSGGAGQVTLSIELKENLNAEARYAEIAIAADGSTQTIAVAQAAFEPTLSLGTTSKEVDVTADSFDVVVTSNIDWETSDVPDWITLSKTSGNGSQTISVTYTENTTTSKRVATIKFKATDYDKEAELTVTQVAFEPTLSLGTTSKEVDVTADSFDVVVTSNIDWETSDVPDWITLSKTSGNGSQTISVTYTENTTTSKRIATIKFKATDYDKEAELTVTQKISQLSDLEKEEL